MLGNHSEIFHMGESSYWGKLDPRNVKCSCGKEGCEILMSVHKKIVGFPEICAIYDACSMIDMLEAMFSIKHSYDIKEINEAEDLMAFVASPFFINGITFYPMDIIDKLSNKGGPDVYVKIAQRLGNFTNDSERCNELKKIAETLR